jgi:hypothetical protein
MSGRTQMTRPLGLLAVAGLVSALAGCMTVDRSVELATSSVVPITVGDANVVPAYDLAAAMVEAGFTEEEILRYGPDVHEALATSGGAQVREGKVVNALMAVHGNDLYITSRSRGTFVRHMTGS